MFHAGGANTTADRVRLAVNPNYHVAYLRQQENQYLAVPRAAAAAMPEALQKVLGYNGDWGLLGKVDGISPLELIQTDGGAHVNPRAAPDPWRHRPRPMPHASAGPAGERVGVRPGVPQDVSAVIKTSQPGSVPAKM